ncbi:MAG TPA: dienelactone hydrolase family protein [Chthoniobacterales bacterium]|nr:dienelactone hydrolase family protein [Chthoniobacterales bacterium]
MNRWGVAAGTIWLLLGFASSLKAADANPASLFFESAGRKIRVDRYSPTGRRSNRTVIVLHGAGGTLFDGPTMRRVARALADDGDTVYLMHYFNRTGTIGALDSTMQAHFDEWLETLRDGIQWVQRREEKVSIGIYGYSLGGFLAIAAASDNPLVAAVTEQAGGIWNSQEKRVGKMPPVLMVHGLEDKRVPVEKYAKPLRRILRARGGHVESDFVPGQGHVFSESAMAVVRPKVTEFFARELR